MGMRTGIYGSVSGLQSLSPTRSAGSANAGYASGGTSSYPVTGFPASAYLGNNRRVNGSYQASPSAVSSTLGNISQLSKGHVVIALVVIVGVGYALWHLDNKR
jgi:hypothetical protein